ncbi:hypothetical protein LUZ60_017298 [Juncus effusus]|nr:hypothetical protein LUZ60_017298 [Juncus effusus]
MKFNKGVALFLTFLFLIHNDPVVADVCDYESRIFHGRCISSKTCTHVCLGEDSANKGGYCKGVFRRKCHCLRECGGISPPDNPPHNPPPPPPPPHWPARD